MHPLLENLKQYTDTQLEEKIQKLSSAYFVAGDEQLRHQIILLIDSFKIELEERRVAARLKQEQNGNDDLDNLINIR